MSTQELIAEIRKLPVSEQRRIFQALRGSLGDASEASSADRADVPASELRGIAKPDGATPTDEQIKDDYTRYLSEKYT